MLAVVGVYLHVHRGADVDLFEVSSVVWWEVVVRQANGLDGGAPWDARGRLQRDIAGVKGAHFCLFPNLSTMASHMSGCRLGAKKWW